MNANTILHQLSQRPFRAKREPFITAVFYIAGPRDGGSAVVVLSETPPDPDWYSGFEPRTLLGRSGYYQIGDDGNYHWFPFDK